MQAKVISSGNSYLEIQRLHFLSIHLTLNCEQSLSHKQDLHLYLHPLLPLAILVINNAAQKCLGNTIY